MIDATQCVYEDTFNSPEYNEVVHYSLYPKPFNDEEEQKVNGWHEFEPGKYIYDEMEANP